MKLSGQRGWMSVLFTGALILSCVLLASCDTGNVNSMSSNFNGAGGRGCTRVGILLPETVSSVRWETEDHPLLVQAIKAVIPNVHIDYNNALGNSATQINQAGADLANRDCILVVGPHDSVAAAPIVAMARADNVPVIAYDRLIQSKELNYYVSFNGVKVGQLQAQYIAEHYRAYQRGATVNVIMIDGSQTDTNALLFSQGAHSVLDPLFANGTFNNVYETFTPNYDSSVAQAEVETALTNKQNNIQIAYVANDGMAGGVIAALQAANLAGKVLVTGQDATATGVHDILLGTQSMTVYKPIEKEAQSVGELVSALYKGTDTNALTHGATVTTFDGGNIPSILDNPISVDRSNIAATVIADHFLTKSEVCSGIPAGTAGVC
jgi:D-xylose transport system substrate-binding protein